MPKFLVALLLSFFISVYTSAEVVPAPANADVRHYLKIPEGGLRAFLKRPTFSLPMVSHHRGGPVPGFPENSIAAMDNALKYGFGFMEVDVAQLKDGTLILMHDDTLARTTTGEGALKNMTWADVKDLKLKDNDGTVTSFHIPKLRDVLRWSVGRTILTLDIKRGTNFKRVADLVTETGTQDYAAAIAYTMEQAKTFHRLAPNMPMSIGLSDDDDIAAFDRSGVPSDLVIAWTGTSLKPEQHYKKLHSRGWRVIVGTLGRPDRSIDGKILSGTSDVNYIDIAKAGADIIATDRFWAVQREIANQNLGIYNVWATTDRY